VVIEAPLSGAGHLLQCCHCAARCGDWQWHCHAVWLLLLQSA